MTKIIAELGINHDGSFDRLLSLTDLAFSNGADYVKIQIKTPRLSVPKAQWDVPKETPWGETLPYIEYKNKMELTPDQISAFIAYVETNYPTKGVFPSVWDMEALELAIGLGFDIIKIPSAKLTDHEMISKLATYHEITPMVSTGMSTTEEVRQANALFEANGRGDDVIWLSCTSTYPADDAELNLNRVRTLREMFPFCQVGFSSHSKSPYPSVYAIVLGAEWVEVHFTDDRSRKGTDHSASLEPNGLSLICRENRRIRVAMGDGKIAPYESEKPYIAKLRG